MDSDILKSIENLKNKMESQCRFSEINDLDKSFRELKTELYIKRNQVKQLTSDLETANTKLHELTKDLDDSRKKNEESQINLNLVLRKSNTTDEQFQEIKNAFITQNLQYKMAVAEVESIKEANQKISKENLALSRKLEVLAAKNTYDSIYQDEIATRESHIRSSVIELKSLLEKLTTEQEMVKQIGNQIDVAKNSFTICKALKEENEKLKNQKLHFECLFVKTNAKLEKLEDLFKENSQVNTPSLLSEIIFKQWQQAQESYAATSQLRNGTLSTLSDDLIKEKALNFKLIQENESLKEKNEYLEKCGSEKFDDIIPITQNIKVEEIVESPIEIYD